MFFRSNIYAASQNYNFIITLYFINIGIYLKAIYLKYLEIAFLPYAAIV